MTAERNPIQETELVPGLRVRVRSRTPLLRLRTDVGTIVRKDEWADYYIVRLDQPADYHDGEGAPIEQISEIRVDADDVEALPLVRHGR